MELAAVAVLAAAKTKRGETGAFAIFHAAHTEQSADAMPNGVAPI